MELANKSTIIAWLFLILIGLQTACSKDCLVADTNEEIQDAKLNKNHLYLYIKTTGFNEKERFIQLFSAKPEFDACGTPSVEPVTERHIDASAGNVEKLIIQNAQIKVVYSKTKRTSPEQITVVLE